MPEHPAQRQEGRAYRAALSVIVVLGAVLRFWQLRAQVLIDDEWHALRRLLSASYRDIFSHFGWADYSIPLTAWYRFLHEHGGLDEWTMRLPMAIAGSALPLLAAWLTRDLLDRTTRLLLAALLAVSPMLVYLSRTARPYALVATLALVALLAFHLAWQCPRHRHRNLALYLGCSALAAWLHLLSLACTLAPFVWFGVRALWQRDANAMGRLALVGTGLLVLLAILLTAPLVGDWNALAGKTGGGQVSAHSAWRTLLMLLGTRSAVAAAILVLLMLLGTVRLLRQKPVMAGYLLSAVLMTTVLTTLLQPAWVQHPGVYARYLLPALAPLLLFAAAGASTVLQSLPQGLRWPAATAAMIALVFLGPLPNQLYSPNQFMGHPYFQFDVDPQENRYVASHADQPVPAFVQQLGSKPARSLKLIQTPWQRQSGVLPYALYQRVHRQDVRLAMAASICDTGTLPDPVLDGRHLQMRNTLELEALLHGETRGADLLIVHHRPQGFPVALHDEWPELEPCLPLLVAHLGEPIYADGEVSVFQLPVP